MKKEYAIVLIGILFLLSIIYGVIFGNPITKFILKKNAAQYLDNRYEEKMIITRGWYNFKEGNYYFSAHPEGNEKLSFKVYSMENKNEFGDLYIIRSWEYEVNSELGPFVESLYINQNSSARIIINRNPINYISKTEIPNYNSVKNKIKYSTMYFSISESDSSRDEQYDSGKIFKLLEFIKEKGYTPDEIRIYFDGITEEDEEIVFSIKYSDLPNINTPQDIEQFKN